MDLSYLKTFVGVVESGSISRYSEESGLSLSTVSNRLDRAEEFFGSELLVRGREGVALTDEGRFVLTNVSHVLGHLERAREGVEDVLSVDVAVAEDGVPEYVADVLRRSGVGVARREGEEIGPMVAAGEAEYGLVRGNGSLSVDDGVSAERLGDGDLVCVVPEGSRLVGREPLSSEDLAGFPLIGVEGDVGERVESGLSRRGWDTEEFGYVYTAGDSELQLELVSTSLGVAVTTRVIYAVLADRFDGLRALEVEGSGSGRGEVRLLKRAEKTAASPRASGRRGGAARES